MSSGAQGRARGRISLRRAGVIAIVLILWLLVLATGGRMFSHLSTLGTNDRAQFLPDSAESTQVSEIDDAYRAEGYIYAITVFTFEEPLEAHSPALMERQIQRMPPIDGVPIFRSTPLIVSDDQLAAEMVIPVDADGALEEATARLGEQLALAVPEASAVYITGPAALSADIITAFRGIDGLLLLVALGAVLIILIVVCRSALLPLIVLTTSLAALCAAVIVVSALARSGAILLAGQTQGILLILVVGATTNYALLYIARYAEALREHVSSWEATRVALRRAWQPILASGLTVILALLVLLVSRLESNRTLGPIAAIGIAFALLASFTLLPALLAWASGGPGGIDDVEGEGGDDILIGSGGGTKRYHGGLGWDWITYYGQPGSTADWAYNRIFEPNNPLPDRFDLLEAMSGGQGNDTLRGPIVNPDDLAASEIELNRATPEALARIGGLTEMLRPTVTLPGGEPFALGDFAAPFLRGSVESDSDGVHKIVIGGPGSDVIEGRGGNDYLDGDAMLRVRLTAGGQFYDSAAQLQALVFSGAVNPGDIDIVRDIVFDDPASGAIDTAQYRNAFSAYTITPIGPLGSGYWRVEHTQVAEPEESDGTDIIRGFEKLQFADGCAVLAEDGMSWESCAPTAAVTLAPLAPVEADPVSAFVWQVDAAGNATDVPFDVNTVTNLRYEWWAGEGDTVDTVTEWEVVPNLLGSASSVFIPSQAEVGMFLRVTVSYTDADGNFRTATSAVSEQPVAEGPSGPGTLVMLHAVPLVPGVDDLPA